MPDVVAKLKKVIWRSLENDFTIASFEPEKKGLKFIATGDLFKPAAGITYEMSGEWKDHPKYGKQFKIESYCVKAPCDSESIAVYLEKYVKGVGPILADKLIEKYRKDTIRILKNAPERVSNENKRISYELALKISEQLQEGDKRQDVLIQLEGLFAKIKGLPKRLATDMLNVYGLSAHEAIKSNPYVLTDMNRIGFISADKVGTACGIKLDDPERIKAGVLYVIRQTMQESGGIWLKPSVIAKALFELINGLKPVVIGNVLNKLVDEKVLIECKGFVTLANYAADEDLIADCVGRFL